MKFFLSIFFVISSVNFTATWKDLEQKIIRVQTFYALSELNNGLEHIRLKFGKRSLESMNPVDTAHQMIQNEWVSSDVFIDPGSMHLDFKDSKFIDTRFKSLDDSILRNELKFNSKQIKRGLDHKKAIVRDFMIHWLSQHLTLTLRSEPVLKALLREKSLKNIVKFSKILRSDLMFWKIPYQKSIKLSKKLKVLWQKELSLNEKCEIWFLSHSFSKFKPKTTQQLIRKAIDLKVPAPFIQRMLKGKTILIEQLANDFKAGVGLNLDYTLGVLSAFKDNHKALNAMVYSLINRKLDPYFWFQAKIIRVWEKLSQIKWKGSDKPYVNWYKLKRRKLLKH